MTGVSRRFRMLSLAFLAVYGCSDRTAFTTQLSGGEGVRKTLVESDADAGARARAAASPVLGGDASANDVGSEAGVEGDAGGIAKAEAKAESGDTTVFREEAGGEDGHPSVGGEESPGGLSDFEEIYVAMDDAVSVMVGNTRQLIPSLVVKEGEVFHEFSEIENPEWTFEIVHVEGVAEGSGGEISHGVFVAPASIPGSSAVVEVKVGVANHPEVHPKVVRVLILPQEGFGTIDDHVTQACVGYVYRLESGTQQLPDFSTMTPLQQIMLPNFAVSDHDWMAGFPGVQDLVEWFGIRFICKLRMPADGSYTFKLRSDDGSNLYLRQGEQWEKVVDNDGVHASREAQASLTLQGGTYEFMLDYFQGPRVRIGLELYWKRPGGDALEIIPADFFVR